MSRATLTPTHTGSRQRPVPDSELSEASESDPGLPKLVRHRTKDLLSSRRNSVPTLSVKKSNQIQLKILRRWSEDQRRAIEARPLMAKVTSLMSGTSLSPLSEDEARTIKSFVFAQLQQRESDPIIKKLLESLNSHDSLLDQCLGLSPLTMGIPDWSMLDWMRHELNQIPFIEDDPAFAKFTQAVENCPQQIRRVRDDILRTITIALDKCLHNDKHPLQLRGHPASADATSITHQKLETFMTSAKVLLGQESGDLTAADMHLTIQFMRKLSRHVPHTRLGSFKCFVHIANRYCKDKAREV